MSTTLFDLVSQCNSVPDDIGAVAEREGLYQFTIGGRLVGHLSAADIAGLKGVVQRQAEPVFIIDDYQRTLTFNDKYGDCASRSAAVAELLAQMRSEKTWASLSKWRDELYPVYDGSSSSSATESSTSSCGAAAAGAVVMIERAASYNFGIRTYGVHINGYTCCEESGQIRMWLGLRSKSKPTWPVHLDQLAAGGIGNGMDIWESAIKECGEEAGIPPAIAKCARYAGTIQYFTRSELGLQPETQFVLDLELPADFKPVPNDGEVATFFHMTMSEVMARLKMGEFKPNSAACMIDFMVRRGFITPDSEPNYIGIVDGLHRPLPYPGPPPTPARKSSSYYY